MWTLFFPGQGSQASGMGRWLFDEFSTARRVFEEASDALHIDLKKLCFEGPEEELQKTENTQPAIVTTSLASYRCMIELIDIHPINSAGHSVGEYAAFAAANVLSLTNAVKAVRERGLAMQNAVPLGKGGMCALLNLEDQEVQTFCDWATKESGLGLIEAANFNTPGQVVISGMQSTLTWAQENWSLYKGPGSDKKVRWIPLKVSAPFHCSLMKPAEEKMTQVLNAMTFENSKWPIIQNFTAKETSDAELLKKNLIKQISGTVRWTESVKRTIQLGGVRGIELGHGQVIRGLNKKINSELEMFSFQNLEDLNKLEDFVKNRLNDTDKDSNKGV